MLTLTYDPSSQHNNWVVGMKFNNAKKFREAIRRYAMTRGASVSFKKNEAGRIRLCTRVDVNGCYLQVKTPLRVVFR